MILEMALVIAITDGDTVKVMDNQNQHYKIRLASIDAPERKQPFGKKSTELLASKIGNQRVTLNCPNKDRYGRWICGISYQGQDVNRWMVEQGGAWVYRQYYKGKDYYIAENTAKDQQLGLWKTSEYQVMPPWEWRKAHK
ncbi:thermonuclease family protein [Neptunomonas phycophila]|uniref:thermonuclease family protein n=1 Tax=Neptunomonas phycophila TaxID=1572645 RepID=UPI0035125CAD